MKKIKDIQDLVGDTPLIRLKGPSEETGCEIFGKAEFFNPGQSIKDRAALHIIKDAERNGLLKKGRNDSRGNCRQYCIGLS
jgi:Cysteine synthase